MKGEENMIKTYRTITGDTWDGIAYKTLGNCFYMDLLIKENIEHSQIFIFPAGIELVIPEVEIEPSAKLPPWKRGVHHE